MSFERIKTPSASDECALSLRRAILSGQLRVGEKLPPERKLAEQFGVNRLTLRAALAQLSGAGLLKVKHGSGYTVADVSRVGGPDLFPDLIELAREDGSLSDMISDLLDVRRGLARTLLGRLSRVATAESLDQVELAIDAFERVCDDESSSVDDFVEADLNIVSAMVNGAKSVMLRMCMNPVVIAVSELHELNAVIYAEPRDNLAGHRLLLSWLRNPQLASVDYVIDELTKRDERTMRALNHPNEERPQ